MIEIDMKLPSCCDECFAFNDYGCMISGESCEHSFKSFESRMPSCPMKEREPRVLTLEEVIKHYSLPPVFVDDLSAQEDYLQDIAPLYFDFPQCDSWAVHWRGYQSVRKYIDDWKSSYGKTWRCWSARPTDEQREVVPWTE